jgi:hypothetical protein
VFPVKYGPNIYIISETLLLIRDRPVTFFTERDRILKPVPVYERINRLVMEDTEAMDDCAGEAQQKLNLPTDITARIEI